MATSLVSTGLQFPDSTIQTTAATAGGGSIEAVASGSLANGDLVVINTDGTVSVVSQTGSAQSAGSANTVAEGSRTYPVVAYESTANKIVVAFADVNNAEFGTAVVGTISGTSISFGTPVVFYSNAVQFVTIVYNASAGAINIGWRYSTNSIRVVAGVVSGTSISFGSSISVNGNGNTVAMVYHAASGQVVIAYRDLAGSNYGNARLVATSGTTVTVGDESTFNAASTIYISLAYDSTNEKVIAVFTDAGENRGVACVGSVSGTTLSWGATTYVGSSGNEYNAATYDPSSGKVVVAYAHTSTGWVNLGTVSGTDITFGGAEVYFNAVTTYNISISYNSAAQKVVLAYSNGGNSNYATIRGLKVSGSSITFDAPIAVSSASTGFTSLTYDSSTEKNIVVYRDTDTGWPFAVVYTPNTLSENLTSENYIGISNGAYSDSETATIQVAGAVDDAQTGLTAGQAYYVQVDGTLSTTPDDPSVFAGTAVSSTKIIVKG